jgi:hypothetical protein
MMNDLYCRIENMTLNVNLQVLCWSFLREFNGSLQRIGTKIFLRLKLGFRLGKISNHLKGILGNSLKEVRDFSYIIAS